MSTNREVNLANLPGVPNNYNISIRDYIDEPHPLDTSFYLDEQTIKVTSVILHYNIQRISEITGEVIKDFLPQKDSILIHIDGVKKATIDGVKGNLNLTEWITTPGWREVTIHSTNLIRITGQLNIKSYVKFWSYLG